MKIEIQCGKVMTQAQNLFVPIARCEGTLLLDTEFMGTFNITNVVDMMQEFYIVHAHEPQDTEPEQDTPGPGTEGDMNDEDNQVVDFQRDPGPERFDNAAMERVLDDIDEQVKGSA